MVIDLRRTFVVHSSAAAKALIFAFNASSTFCLYFLRTNLEYYV